MDKDRENFVYIAKLAEQAERYDGWSTKFYIFVLFWNHNLFIQL